MKRFFCLLMSVLLPFSAVSCTSLDDAKGGTRETSAEKPLTATEEKGPIKIPEGFSVGFSRRVVNPKPGTSLGGFPGANKRLSQVIQDDIMLSCLAISDGENKMLFFSSDSIHVGAPIAEDVAKIAEECYGIPKDNVIMNGTHTHSGPSLYTTKFVGIAQYVETIYYPAAKEMMEEALRDLAPAEIYVGRSQTEGLNYVRRYMNTVTGEYAGKNIPFGSDPDTYAHETEADREMRVIRFAREDTKDIVLCNWQCHATHIGKSTGTTVSSDFVAPFREEVEKRGDVHFIYMQGAAANVTPKGRIEGDNRNSDYQKHGAALASCLFEALESAAPVSSGKLRAKRLKLTLPYSAKYCEAEELPSGTTTDMSLYAFSFGDVCIGTVPGEWFDTLGKELREKSPFPVTLVAAYTNGTNGYFPAEFAFDHGGYEVKACRHEKGTSEMFRDELLKMLGECHSAQ